jgi:hypothetical protein
MEGVNVAHIPGEMGTGHKTPPGDAPEPNALAHVFGLVLDPDQPCRVGYYRKRGEFM